MKLTAKQESFAQAIADGMNQSDAYRHAYDASKSKPNAINVNASKMMANAKVALRVAELREALQSKALWSREDSVRALKKIAVDTEVRPGDKTAAIKELNAMHGYLAPTKAETKLTGGFRVEYIIVDPKA